MNESLPIQALTDTHPAQVVDFLDGCSIIRESLGSRKLHDAHLFLPLRGAMPIFWAASGDPSIEDQLDQPIVELPLGIYRQDRPDGSVRITSPEGNQKHEIIRSVIGPLYHENIDMKICLLDEVQKGGTITLASSLTRNCMRRLGIKPPLYVLAAQDSRARVVREKKTRNYEKMASNSAKDIDANVIAMPLIATDRNALLDTVYLSNSAAIITDASQFRVERNVGAEKLIRGIATMARCALVRYDRSYIRELIDESGGKSLDESHAGKLESWVTRFVADSKPSADRPRPCGDR